MLLPLMLTLYLGGVEVSQGVSIDRKVTLTARTVADLVAQVSSINNAGMNAVLEATAAVLAPYPTATAKVTVSVRQHRRQQQRQGRVERARMQRHGHAQGFERDAFPTALNDPQHLAGLG